MDEKKEARKIVAKKGPKASAPSTKRFLDISEIRDNLVVMKDGTLRAVLLVSSINFYLKSDEEQEAIISAYVDFLNSLESPIQIVVQSRKLDIAPYMRQLKEMEEKHESELLRNQTADYREFLGDLIEYGHVMDRRYFAVIPYNPLGNKQKGFIKRLSELWSPGATVKLKEDEFQKRKHELDLLISRVASGLSSMSLEVTQLDTQGLIELYYETYNPDIAQISKLPEQINEIQVL